MDLFAKSRLLLMVAAIVSATPTRAADNIESPQAAAGERAAPATPDSLQMERDLQHLNWKQFRSVIESVPKMKADVDAYGPLGWQYVKGNYVSYGWHKSIDRLDPAQKEQLATLIEAAKAAH